MAENSTSLGQINSIHQHFLTSMIPGMETQNVGANMQEQVQTLVNSMASLLDQIRTVQDQGFLFSKYLELEKEFLN